MSIYACMFPKAYVYTYKTSPPPMHNLGKMGKPTLQPFLKLTYFSFIKLFKKMENNPLYQMLIKT